MFHSRVGDAEVLDDDNQERLDDVVGCVRDVKRGPHEELRAEESEERADREFQEDEEGAEGDKNAHLHEHFEAITEFHAILVPHHFHKYKDGKNEVYNS